jgi:replicative DNA helicase
MQVAPRDLNGAKWHAEQVREAYAARQLAITCQQVADALTEGSSELDSAIGETIGAAERAQEASAALRPISVRTSRDLLAIDPPEVLIVPGLIGEREKLILTGYEGLGKSELAALIGVGAVAGMQPFTGEEHTPRRVLLVDLENPLAQLRRRFRRIVTAMEHVHDFDRELLMVESLEAGMDLLRPDHWTRLRRMVDTARPDILMIGPLYKLAVGRDLNKEEVAVEITSKLDYLRVQHNLATISEAHMAKERGGDGKRMPAPRGSSVFIGWPSIGFGMRPHPSCADLADGERPRIIELKQFRGAREDRQWPTALQRMDGGPGWPVLPFQPYEAPRWPAGQAFPAAVPS